MKLVCILLVALSVIWARSASAQSQAETEEFLLSNFTNLLIEGGSSFGALYLDKAYRGRVQYCKFEFQSHSANSDPLYISLDLTKMYGNTIVSRIEMVGVGLWFAGENQLVESRRKTETRTFGNAFITGRNERFANAFKYFTSNWCQGLKRAF